MVTDPTLQTAFFLEALDYFAKGILTLYSSHVLLRDNHKSWALISAYYSSFYTVNCLLRVQGRGIVHSNKGSDLFWLTPLKSSRQDYIVRNRREGRGEHLHHWKFFYKLYGRFDPPSPHFEPILKEEYFSKEDREESEIRNNQTYRPFSFDEAKSNWVGAVEAFWERVNELDSDRERKLAALCTDPDHRFYARAALRLMLAKNLLEKISEGATFQSLVQSKIAHFAAMKQILQPSQNVREQSVGWSIARLLDP